MTNDTFGLRPDANQDREHDADTTLPPEELEVEPEVTRAAPPLTRGVEERPARPRIIAVVLLLLVGAPTFFAGLERTSLADPEEPRLAETSRQMLTRSDFITPYYNDAPSFDAPVLFHWLQALAFRNLGTTELAARLPAAASGVLAVLLLYLLGVRFMTERAGLLAALALATLTGIVVSARQGVPDLLALALVLLALYGFKRSQDAEGGIFAFVAWTAIALGLLTQGLAGLLPLAVWLLYLILTGRFGDLRHVRFAGGVLVLLLVGSPWYLYMAWMHGRAFVDAAVVADVGPVLAVTDGAALLDSLSRYVGALPLAMGPWVVFAAGGLLFILIGLPTLEPGPRRGGVFAVVWLLVVLALAALSGGNPTRGALMLYPAVALLLGLFVDRAAATSTGSGRGLLGLATWLTVLLLLGLGAAAWLFFQQGLAVPLVSPGMAIPVVAVVAAVTVAVFQRRGQPLRAFGAVVVTAAVAYIVVGLYTLPREIEPFRGTPALAGLIAAQSGNKQIGVVGPARPSLVFYGDHAVEVLDTPEQAASFLAGEGRRFCVTAADDYDALRAAYSGILFQLGDHAQFDLRTSHVLERSVPRDQQRLIVVSNAAPDQLRAAR